MPVVGQHCNTLWNVNKRNPPLFPGLRIRDLLKGNVTLSVSSSSCMYEGKEASGREWLTHDHRAEEGPLSMPEPSSLDQFHLNSNAYFDKGHKMIAQILSYCVENSFKRRNDMFKSIHLQLCISFSKVRSIRHGINLQHDHLKKN